MLSGGQLHLLPAQGEGAAGGRGGRALPQHPHLLQGAAPQQTLLNEEIQQKFRDMPIQLLNNTVLYKTLLTNPV